MFGRKEGNRPTETTPLMKQDRPSPFALLEVPSQQDESELDGDSESLGEDDDLGREGGRVYFPNLKNDSNSIRRESMAADRLSTRLLAIDDDDSEAEERILRESLALNVPLHHTKNISDSVGSIGEKSLQKAACHRFVSMACLVILSFALIGLALYARVQFLGPPNQPAGPYRLLERQVRQPFAAIIVIGHRQSKQFCFAFDHCFT